MLPLSLDLTQLRLALIGNGATAARRLAWLDEAGATTVSVFAAAPSPELSLTAGARLTPHWPSDTELDGIQLAFIVDPPEPQRTALAAATRAAGAIVHVEDVPALSDVHAPAVLRRGDLTIAISTNGAAPGLAAELKQFLGQIFGPEWRDRVNEMRALRQRWRKAGVSHELVRHLTASQLARHGWLRRYKNMIAANDRSEAIMKEEVDYVSETR
jgi:precorrin-2 dehydrogenase/sirohydrochlorin ferrochelatase